MHPSENRHNDRGVFKMRRESQKFDFSEKSNFWDCQASWRLTAEASTWIE